MADTGTIYLVGAGPGDPDLLTIRAARLIERARIIVHDGLVDPAIMMLARDDAELISVAKRRSHHTLPQEAISDLLVRIARSGEDVVRLIGSPSSVATFNPNVWYYISSKQEQFAFFKQTTISQSVLQLNFDEGGRLQTQKSYDMADAKDITMVARITPTTGKELTVLEQILGNVGRFSGPRQDSNPGAPTGGI